MVAPVPLDDYIAGERPLTLIGNRGAAWVYERARVLPLARLVGRVEVIGDEAAAIARVHAADFDPAVTVILDTPPPCVVDAGGGHGRHPGTARRLLANRNGQPPWRCCWS
ncbi:MAG: hypothetical protein IPM39_21130 [Chloroflexi bacterium]|nr:hypothetical protein [Chloroflexota bacterium]